MSDYKVLDPRAPHLKHMAQFLSAGRGVPKWIQMSGRIAHLMLEKHTAMVGAKVVPIGQR